VNWNIHLKEISRVGSNYLCPDLFSINTGNSRKYIIYKYKTALIRQTVKLKDNRKDNKIGRKITV